MRILLVTESLAVGGAETFVIRLANALSLSNEVTIAVMRGELANQALVAKIHPMVRIEQLIVPVLRISFKLDGLARRLGIDRSIVRAAQRRWLARLIDEIRPDIAHSHLLKADCLVAEVRGRQPAMRHIVTMHGDYALFLSGEAASDMIGLERLVENITATADAIVAICAEHRDFIRTRFPGADDRAHLIYNGFAPWRPPPDPVRGNARVVFAMASRGVKLKGWAKAIAAFAQLPPGSSELLLIGAGPELNRLAAGPIPPGVRFIGFSDNPADWIMNSDVGLLPSEFRTESLPTAVMEYLYCGKPVIATDVGEIGSMLQAPGGLAGVLLPFVDAQVSIDDLAAAMRAYIDDPSLRRAHAALAGSAFAKFDMAECAGAYARLYAEVTG